MFQRLFLQRSLNIRLIAMMLFLSSIMITVLLFIYSQAERSFLNEVERQTSDLTKAIQIGVEEVTGPGKTDEARLSKYLAELKTKGVGEITIISNAKEVLASTNPQKVGQPLTHRKKELIIKAEMGEPVSEEGKAYNVILPVVAGETQYGYIHLRINKDDFTSLIRENTMKRIAATISVFGLGIILALFLSRHYTRPIQQVVHAARRVAAGDLNQSIPVQSNDEIGQLSEAFNFMVLKIKEARTLEQKLREAEHLSGLGQLSRDMAHEIRNPLNFINLSIDHIADKYPPGDPSRQENFVQLIGGIKIEIQRLNKLVTEFLDYSRPIRLNLRPCRIDMLIEDVIALTWAKAEAEGIEIVRDYGVLTELMVDPDLFKSCIMNIVTNAFYSMDGKAGEKKISVRTTISDEQFILTITDSGEGISEENLHRIFEPFFTTRQNGLGLGLPMTKRVIEEHGGTVVFTSVEGQGTEVRLSMPLQGFSGSI